MAKTYLVTGGCGFIGSHLAAALVARGDRVRVLDDLSTGHRANAPAAAEIVVGDVADPDTVARAMDGADGCFHLAAVASVQRSTEAWHATHRINLGGSINVFESARRGPGGRTVPVVYASSAAVYGDNAAVPLAEDATLAPLTPYGADKAGSELHARAAGAVFGVPTVGLRFFNVYGPRQDPRSPYSGVISIFADRIAAGRPITIFGDGRQSRDFVYVSDVVAALLASMAGATTAPAVYNVCTGRPTTLLELVAALESATGKRAAAGHGPARAGDIRVSLGAPGRIEAALGIRPRVTLAAGLSALMDWINSPRAA
jgi:UDP-glucose 4-epimerase